VSLHDITNTEMYVYLDIYFKTELISAAHFAYRKKQCEHVILH